MQKVILASSSLVLFFASILCFVLHTLIRMSITGFIFYETGHFLIPLGFVLAAISIICFIVMLWQNIDTASSKVQE